MVDDLLGERHSGLLRLGKRVTGPPVFRGAAMSRSDFFDPSRIHLVDEDRELDLVHVSSQCSAERVLNDDL